MRGMCCGEIAPGLLRYQYPAYVFSGECSDLMLPGLAAGVGNP
jgi:hypothetical protein